MKKYLIPIILIATLMYASTGFAWMGADWTSGGAGGVADHCAALGWTPTLTTFVLDFDNETGEQACESGVDGETGVLTGATIVTPATVSPGSGGKALLIDGDNNYIDFDNTNTVFITDYGTIVFSLQPVGNNDGNDYILNIIETSLQERLKVLVNSFGVIVIQWEDNNDARATFSSGIDIDAYYGDWIEFEIFWDTERCTDGTCDGTDEEEIAIRYQVDDARDGTWDGWNAWVEESQATDANTWATEPSTNDFQFGVLGTTWSTNYYLDDIQIGKAKPTWP